MGERIIEEWVTAKILPLNVACLYLFSKTVTAVTKSEDDLLQPFLFANFPCPMLRWGTSICRLTFPGSRTTEQHSSAPQILPSQANAQWPVQPQIKGLCAYSFGKAPDFHRIPLPTRGKSTLRNTCTSFITMVFCHYCIM